MEKKIKVTKKTLAELGKQVKSFLTEMQAKIDDYKFSVIGVKDGISIEFYVKASIKSKEKKK